MDASTKRIIHVQENVEASYLKSKNIDATPCDENK
jgi:hypothetical protein